MSILLTALVILANETAIQKQPKEMRSYNNYLLELGVGKSEVWREKFPLIYGMFTEMKAEKCYGSYGCYNLNPPWTSDHRPVSMFPEMLEKVSWMCIS